jgi:hypothetical protein
MINDTIVMILILIAWEGRAGWYWEYDEERRVNVHDAWTKDVSARGCLAWTRAHRYDTYALARVASPKNNSEHYLPTDAVLLPTTSIATAIYINIKDKSKRTG